MNDHKGIRPQDIIVVLWFALNYELPYTLPMLGGVLGISPSEISKSIKRSQYAGLMNSGKRVAKETFLEFLRYGLPYVFPARPGAPVRGVPTAISHPDIREAFDSSEVFVWPHASGSIRGYTVEPLYSSLPGAIPAHPELYFAAALIDLFRIGKTREKRYAEEQLSKLLSIESASY